MKDEKEIQDFVDEVLFAQKNFNNNMDFLDHVHEELLRLMYKLGIDSLRV